MGAGFRVEGNLPVPQLSGNRRGRLAEDMSPLLLLVLCSSAVASGRRDRYTNHWAVQILGGPDQADAVAAKYGYRNLGQIGGLQDLYHFHHSRVVRRATLPHRGPHSLIHLDAQVRLQTGGAGPDGAPLRPGSSELCGPADTSVFLRFLSERVLPLPLKVAWAQQQLVKPRVKRIAQTDPAFLGFNDPKWSSMWYINCQDDGGRCRSDMNVLAAWQRGYTGRNVVVSILDDGIERNHPDLSQNYDHLASYDINGNDHDPTPRYDSRNENVHGTRCAGEVAAAANNSQCIVGIAYNAHIGGIRMLDGDVTDIVEAKSLGIRPDYIHIYSASWGPKDDGRTVDGPGPLTRQAFERGIQKGRRGLGSIFVWAAGNGGRQADHCSCDGYTSSIYTISVSSTTENGNRPWYLEVCSSIMVTTYSSGEFHERKIVTTDLWQRCTDAHTGTSISAPIVAGVIALALEANFLLSWRDVQHLLVKTSRPAHLKAEDWKTNAAGLTVSHLYGFGLVDADAMVMEARRWRPVPPQHTCSQVSGRRSRHIHAGLRLNSSITTSGCSGDPQQHVQHLEHVVVKVLLLHPRRGDLEMELISPAGTRSQLLARRLLDSSSEGFRNWEFMTVHFWAETPNGTWTLEVKDTPSKLRNLEVLGNLKEWTLILYGTSQSLYQDPTAPPPRSGELEIPEEPEEEEEEEKEYNGSCHRECGDRGCDGPAAEHCLSCSHFSLASLKRGRTCVLQCPRGTYKNETSRLCRRCFRGCETCDGQSARDCLSCRRGLYLNLLTSSCLDTCPPGTFPDESQRRCVECHASCMECVQHPDVCTACHHGYSLAGMACVPECGGGTFFHVEELRCRSCHSSCRTCSGPGAEQCLRCAEGYLQQEWGCVQVCSPGFYAGEAAGLPHQICTRCEENCLSCSGPRSSCSKCKAGFSLISRTCLKNASCSNADEVFCEMVKTNRLCHRKFYRQFCCRTCLMNA
ncbi:proprotein convertase subtilisin/kexin type 6 isoform X4 [Oryzias latipes]|uniref:proprotein convertase subtilisin/kexin type 6 isoform X4 n=1 Tax=Oryzias latipes TaxID=8090 RepID=UPI0009DA37E8|nr:proprotein convertase subtilisin/kexin type 6 isoform X4 [Oryzias latipes]